MCVPSVCAGHLSGQIRTPPAKYSGRHRLCQVCERRLDEAKGKPYSCPPGLMCHKCYDKRDQSAAVKRPLVAPSDAVPAPKRVRRTQSDPGEPMNLTRKRTRAEPPVAVPTKKTRVRHPAVDPSPLLDQSHAQRLALLAAVATDAAHCVLNASAVVFDT
jgi:hypothetical protein